MHEQDADWQRCELNVQMTSTYWLQAGLGRNHFRANHIAAVLFHDFENSKVITRSTFRDMRMLNWSCRVYTHTLHRWFNMSRVIHIQGDILIEAGSEHLFSLCRISPKTLIFLEAPASLYLDPMAILQVILTLLLAPHKRKMESGGWCCSCRIEGLGGNR